MKNENLIVEAIDKLRGENKEVTEILRRFLMTNQANTRCKFDLYNCVEKDGLRPAMRGVFHENGKRIATNVYALFVLNNEVYPSEYEGKIIDKTGLQIDEKYVNYNAVIPSKENMQITWHIDRERIQDAIKQERVNRKAFAKSITIIRIGKICFLPSSLMSIANFAAAKGEDTLYLKNECFPACVYCEDGSFGLIMHRQPIHEGTGEDIEHIAIIDL